MTNVVEDATNWPYFCLLHTTLHHQESLDALSEPSKAVAIRAESTPEGGEGA